MISIDLINFFQSQNFFTKEEFESYESRIPELLEKIEERDQDFYKIIDDSESIAKIKTFNLDPKLKNICILGIGGSALGSKFLNQALRNKFNQNPKLYILDTIDPDLISEFENSINLEETLFIVISKSGSTVETTTLYDHFKKKSNNFIFITEDNDSYLRNESIKYNYPYLEHPQKVGGRFAVLSVVGLLAAHLQNINIEKLIEGAKRMRESFFSTNFEQNIPFQLATIQYLMHEKGISIHTLMPYTTKLEAFTEWFTQLLSESIGKEGKGLTPLRAVGPTDQHSQLQLYQDGPTDKFINFIEVEKYQNEIDPFTNIIKAQKKGTEMALTESSKPNFTIKIEKIDEENIGELVILYECAISFLGELLEINAFDQPGVELSKKLTKNFLTN